MDFTSTGLDPEHGHISLLNDTPFWINLSFAAKHVDS